MLGVFIHPSATKTPPRPAPLRSLPLDIHVDLLATLRAIKHGFIESEGLVDVSLGVSTKMSGQ